MKKKIISLLIVLMLVSAGCSQPDVGKDKEDKETTSYVGAENEGEVESTTSGNEEDDAESEEEEKTSEFTVDAVRMLAEKHGELTLEDLGSYVHLETAKTDRRFVKDIEFTYNEEALVLRIVAFEGELLSTFICDKSFFEEETLKNEYSYTGRYGDIRTGNIEHILNGTVTIEDYVKVKLPDGVGYSALKHWLGTRGGVFFVSQELLDAAQTAENFGIYTGSADGVTQVGGIEIFGSGDFGQSVNTLEEFEPISVEGVNVARAKVEIDNGYTWYVAYTNQEDANISYCFYWNSDLFTEDEFLGFTETIELMENAIY